MVCKKCGSDIIDGLSTCPACGAPIEEQNVFVDQNADESVASRFVAAFKDPLYLVGCILVTVGALKFNLMCILFAVFMWLIYSNAQKNSCDVANMRRVSGCVYATKVINWISVGLCAFCALISIAAIGAISTIYDSLKDSFGLPDISEITEIFGSTEALASVLGIIIAVAFIIGIAVLVLYNLLIVKPFHKFAKSLYVSAQTGIINLERPGYVANAMLVVGIISALGVLGSMESLLTLLTSASGAAMYIVMYIWIKKYFVNAQ